MLKFDYISDLHIDHWDKKYWNCGKPDEDHKHFPIDWEGIDNKSDILVVAGDVSDKLDISLKYLKSLRKYYSIILFIDGNHEHTDHYPELLSPSKIKPPEGIHYLRNQDYVIGRSVFIGTCGWWDYGNYNDPKNLTKTIDAQKSYVKMLGKNKHRKLAENLILQSRDDYRYIIDKLEKYSKLSEIDEIIIVTHTVPKPEFTHIPVVEYNGQLEKISDQQLQEYGVSRWIFGHSHRKWEQLIQPLPTLEARIPKVLRYVPRRNHRRNPGSLKTLSYLSNPRGRPLEPWDREVYSIETTGTVPISEACKL
jgi:DNA repair exonuclease SbcCD nuclease subunit